MENPPFVDVFPTNYEKKVFLSLCSFTGVWSISNGGVAMLSSKHPSTVHSDPDENGSGSLGPVPQLLLSIAGTSLANRCGFC